MNVFATPCLKKHPSLFAVQVNYIKFFNGLKWYSIILEEKVLILLKSFFWEILIYDRKGFD